MFYCFKIASRGYAKVHIKTWIGLTHYQLLETGTERNESGEIDSLHLIFYVPTVRVLYVSSR